jgi:hypothetical protein
MSLFLQNHFMAKSAKQQLEANKQEKCVVLEKDFAGVRAGQILFVGTPRIINDYIKKIPFGETRTINRLRNELARKWKANATCPASTAIFIRIAAQAAIDELDTGTPTSKVTPFWRLLTSEDKITRKLSIDPLWVDNQRAMEQMG